MRRAYGELAGHAYNVASCTEPAFCSVCGHTTGEPIGHDFSVFVEAVAATCTAQGYSVYKCSRCDETNTVFVPVLSHKWNSGTVTKAPTCAEAGEVTYTCELCGETKTEVMGITEHSFTIWVANGENSYCECEYCGFRKTVTSEETNDHLGICPDCGRKHSVFNIYYYICLITKFFKTLTKLFTK